MHARHSRAPGSVCVTRQALRGPWPSLSPNFSDVHWLSCSEHSFWAVDGCSRVRSPFVRSADQRAYGPSRQAICSPSPLDDCQTPPEISAHRRGLPSETQQSGEPTACARTLSPGRGRLRVHVPVPVRAHACVCVLREAWRGPRKGAEGDEEHEAPPYIFLSFSLFLASWVTPQLRHLRWLPVAQSEGQAASSRIQAVSTARTLCLRHMNYSWLARHTLASAAHRQRCCGEDGSAQTDGSTPACRDRRGGLGALCLGFPICEIGRIRVLRLSEVIDVKG